jgi:hypothetical protein
MPADGHQGGNNGEGAGAKIVKIQPQMNADEQR